MNVPPVPDLDRDTTLTIVLIGGSGDLVLKKIAPALFGLYCRDRLPKDFHIIAFSRSSFSDAEYREHLRPNLTCRYEPEADCARRIDAFLHHCHYCAGRYDASDSFLELYQAMRAHEGEAHANRLFYMAIPPFLFVDVARSIGNAGLVLCSNEGERWSRVVIEKPFGDDRASSDELVAAMGEIFTEEQTFRIDHYLGKEVIQNLMVLRFANRLFEPLWNRDHIQAVEIDFREKIGTEGRAGYFDQYGIIRDVVQNHLLVTLALTAMERPRRFEAQPLLDEKVAVLRAIAPLDLANTALGQYSEGNGHEAYRDEEGVPENSHTPTYAMHVLEIDNDRWRGVPFIMSAGKGLESKKTEIRIRFKPLEANLFETHKPDLQPNRLVIRVQPDEAITYHFTNKRPGSPIALTETTLDLRYDEAFDEDIPEAYDSLILDVLRGEKSLFIRADELRAAWDIFTPLLHRIDAGDAEPAAYAFGSSGPETAHELARKCGVQNPN